MTAPGTSAESLQEEANVPELTDKKPNCSWTKGRVAMAVVMGLASLSVWGVLLASFGRAHKLQQIYLRLHLPVATATKVSIWIGQAAHYLAVPLSIVFVAGLGVTLWRMKGRTWVGYAIGTLLTLVLLAVYLAVLLGPFPPTLIQGTPK
jgi:hypothetical protein